MSQGENPAGKECVPGGVSVKNPSVRLGTVPWAEQGWGGFRELFEEPFIRLMSLSGATKTNS